MSQSVKSLLAEKNFGIVARVHSTDPNLVNDRVSMCAELANKAIAIEVEEVSVFKRLDFYVWADARYKDSDCGLTYAAMRKEFDQECYKGRVYVHNYTKGDLFCGILNYGVGQQMEKKIHYSTIISTEARSYLTKETVEDMLTAIAKSEENGFNAIKAVGVEVGDISESIRHGRLANTFLMWENAALSEAGFFNKLARKRRDDDKCKLNIESFNKEKNELFAYNLAGVEEVIPLALMIEDYGQCLAPIVPRGEGVKLYQAPDPAVDMTGYLRHINKINTKSVRQSFFLNQVQHDLEYLEGGVAKNYRRF